ncbi:hypothetical protein FCV25MIE_14981 [Fagus crenata]
MAQLENHNPVNTLPEPSISLNPVDPLQSDVVSSSFCSDEAKEEIEPPFELIGQGFESGQSKSSLPSSVWVDLAPLDTDLQIVNVLEPQGSLLLSESNFEKEEPSMADWVPETSHEEVGVTVLSLSLALIEEPLGDCFPFTLRASGDG